MNTQKKSVILLSGGLALLLAFTFALNILSLTKFDNIFEKFFGSQPSGVSGDTGTKYPFSFTSCGRFSVAGRA